MHKAKNIHCIFFSFEKNEMAQGRVPSPISEVGGHNFSKTNAPILFKFSTLL